MHPLNTRYFGTANGTMSIDFYAANAVVSGSIIKQTGSKRFVVSADNGVTKYTVSLADKADLVANLSAGYGTIKATAFGSNTVENVATIHSTTLTTVQGNTYPWTLGPATKAGQAGVTKK